MSIRSAERRHLGQTYDTVDRTVVGAIGLLFVAANAALAAAVVTFLYALTIPLF